MPRFITSDEERVLINHIRELEWQKVALFGQVAKRRVVHFGMDYQYSTRTVKPTKPVPLFLNELLIRATQLLSNPSMPIAEVLITEYPIQAGINWHRDAPVFREIIGVSLSSDCILHFRKRANKKEQIKIHLAPGSAYVLQDAIRWDWEHRIAPAKELRYSITFRTLV